MPTPTKKAAPKQPTDRKPKAAATPTELKVDLRGLKVTVPVDALNDFELMDDLSQMDKGDPTAFPRVLHRLVGDQYDKVIELARDATTKRVTLGAGSELVYALLESLDPNSSGSRDS